MPCCDVTSTYSKWQSLTPQMGAGRGGQGWGKGDLTNHDQLKWPA